MAGPSALDPEASSPSEEPIRGPSMERFVYDDAIARKFLIATLVWTVVATLAGLYVALLLVQPSLGFGLEYTTFGRLRPLHTNAAIFAFAGNAVFAAV